MPSMWLLTLLTLLLVSEGARVADKIYANLEGDMACFKRFNATHEVGCTSAYNGNVGVLFIPRDVGELRQVLEGDKSPKLVLGLEPVLFTREVMLMAKEAGNVNGVLILESENFTKPVSMSPASSCPSKAYGIYEQSNYSDYCSAEQPWNPSATSLLYENFNFPMFLIQNTANVQSITDCYTTHNLGLSDGDFSYPLCALELKSNMFGTTDSRVCLRRKHLTRVARLKTVDFCSALFDYNILAPLSPMSEAVSNSSVIVIAARSDAASLFDNISPGANSAVSGLVTLLAVAEALNAYTEEVQASSNHVVFLTLDGETWDYIGSSSAAFEMDKGEFPFAPLAEDEFSQMSNINISHIKHFIELSQLGMQEQETTTFMHTDPLSNEDPSVAALNLVLKDALKDSAAKFNVQILDNGESVPLPPASFQRFLKYNNISGTVITDFDEGFKNKFYQSMYDNGENINYLGDMNGTLPEDPLHEHLTNIASTVATSVYQLTTNDNSKQITANSTLVAELLHCYLKNVNCTLFRQHAGFLLDNPSSRPYFTPRPAKMYTSVYGGESILTNITMYLLAHFVGDLVEGETAHTCWSNNTAPVQKLFTTTMGENGTCIVSTARKLSAYSPAFRLEDYNMTSGEFSTWTESGWSTTSVRLFMKPSPAEEIGLVVGGVLTFVASLMLTYWCNKKAGVLFPKAVQPVAC